MTTTEVKTKECPYCFEQVDARAKICPHCRKRLDTNTASFQLGSLLLAISLLIGLGVFFIGDPFWFLPLIVLILVGLWLRRR